MVKPSAFQGLRLSGPVPPPSSSVDQRLFTPVRPDAQKPGNQQPRNLGGQEAGREADKTASRPEGRDGIQEPARKGRSEDGKPDKRPFDLSEPAHRKATFMLTDTEFEAMEDLKLSLRREHGRDVPKNDLLRLATHFLLEDYDDKQESSLVVRRLKNRTRRP